MHRVLLACDDIVFCEGIKNAFRAQSDFEVCGEYKNDIKVLKHVMKLVPNLVVMEVQMPPWDSFEIAEALKIILPETPLFLVTEDYILPQVEKVALSTGIDTVFAKGEDVALLVANARAILTSTADNA